MMESELLKMSLRDGPLFALLIGLIVVLGRFLLPLIREISGTAARATNALEAAMEAIERNTHAFEQLHELLLRINGRDRGK